MSSDAWKQRLWRMVDEVALERVAQVSKWGEQSLDLWDALDHPNPCVRASYEAELGSVKYLNDYSGGGYDWYSVLMEEVYEAFLEEDPDKQRQEFIQVAAVALAIINDIDRKKESDG